MQREVAPLPEIIYDKGVHVLGSVLWMDSPRSRELCFVSHSGVPGIRRHSKVLCTDSTARLSARQARVDKRLNALVCPYRRPFSLGPLRMELLPSGYSFGASQLRVEAAGATILYTGDLCLRPTQGVEAAATPAADVLIVDASLASPDLVVPPHREVRARLAAFLADTCAAGLLPVLLCEPLGTAQEVIPFLSELGYGLAAHASITTANEVLGALGNPLPSCRRSRGAVREGEVLLWPWHLRRSPAIRRLRARVAALSENPTVTPDMVPSDAVIPWIRHPTWQEVVRFVERVGPKRVHTFKGQERELAEGLRKLGYDARDLSSGLQMPLFR